MAQQGEAGASVHLPFDHLGLGVNSLGAAVVVRHRDRGRGSLDVQVEAAGEGVHVGQVGLAGIGDSLPELVAVCRVWNEHGRE